MNRARKIVLIPAYKPSESLIALVSELLDSDFTVVTVNDGSPEEFDSVFAQLPDAVHKLTHEVNKGKGAALKTGFAYIEKTFEDCLSVVSADADGQHTVKDICAVSDALGDKTDTILLGCRSFEGDIPFRSKFGNNVTKVAFALSSGVRISDTQTGLRAFPYSLLGFLSEIPGERYEYEINMLLSATKAKIHLAEHPIKTIYIDDNSSSHFHPIRDSIKIYSCILKFTCSSLLSFLIDFILLFIFKKVFDSFDMKPETVLLVSAVCARVLSSAFNFYANKKLVFKSNANTVSSASKYFLLACAILGANILLLELLNIVLGMWLWLAKIIVEVFLFMCSYTVQKKLIFTDKNQK